MISVVSLDFGKDSIGSENFMLLVWLKLHNYKNKANLKILLTLYANRLVIFVILEILMSCFG